MPKELINAITSKLKYRNTSVDVGKRNGRHKQSKMYENRTQLYSCLHFSQQLKAQLVKVKQKVADDSAAVALINHALSNLEQGVNLDKVIFDLKRDLNNYSLSHNFKLPQPLTELQLKLDENPNKWRDAGLTGSI